MTNPQTINKGDIMTSQSNEREWTEEKIKQHIQRIEQEAEKNRRENKGDHFTSLTPEQIRKKLKRVNSPFITWSGWSDSWRGGTFNYYVGIYNPDPTDATQLFVHVWVGPGNIDPNLSTFLLNVDTRFPRLALPAFPGLTVAPSTAGTLIFALTVPTTVEPTNYFGNSCLMQFGNWNDPGTYLDRHIFIFTVS
jgi:hypothetical protein